jgi:hypothetical protein
LGSFGSAGCVEEYFFKSQESLATVIDQTDDIDDVTPSDDVIADLGETKINSKIENEEKKDAKTSLLKNVFQRMSSV